MNRLLKYKDHPSIIFYNITEFDINKIFKNIYTIKNHETVNINKNEFIRTNIYYEVDIQKINICSFLKDITNVHNNIKYIILNNYNNISKLTQYIIKVSIEKYKNFKWIIITNNYTSIISNIKNQFINIRIPKNTHYEKYKSLSNIKIDGFNNHKHFSINTIQLLNSNNLLSNKSLLDNIVDYILNKNISIKNIKEISYFLVSSNINYKDLLKLLLIDISKNDTITNSKIESILKLFCDFDINIDKTYNRLIYYEYLLISLKHILN